MAAARCRQPWDDIGGEDEWKEFTKCDKSHGLYSVPCISEEERQAIFSQRGALGRPMLFMQYPAAQLNTSSKLFSYWYFGSITSVDKVNSQTRPALKIRAFESLGGFMTFEKSVPLHSCRDYERAAIAFRRFCKEFRKSCPRSVKKKEKKNTKPESTISFASSSSSSVATTSTSSTSSRAIVLANPPLTKLSDQPAHTENIAPGTRVGSRERSKRILQDESQADASRKKLSKVSFSEVKQKKELKHAKNIPDELSDDEDDGQGNRKNSDFEVIGDVVYTDKNDGKKFYGEINCNQITVKIGDFLRVNLEYDKNNSYQTGICQVLAIFQNKVKNERILLEVRWFKRADELTEKQKKTLEARLGPTVFQRTELVETDVLDDIPLASIFGKIEIVGFDDKRIDAINPSSTYTVSFSSSFSLSANSSFSSSVSFSTFENESAGSSNLRNRNEKEINDDDVLVFFCRFMESNGSSSLQIVINQSAFKRGMDISHFQHAYKEVLNLYDNADHSLPTDRFSMAIRQLHVSVLPEYLPCRSEEREKIQAYMKDVVVAANVSFPMYISGLPGRSGTGKTATVLASIKSLIIEARNKLIPDFSFVEINCLRISSASEAYTLLWRALSGEFLSSKKAEIQLAAFFRQRCEAYERNDDPERKHIICLMDELDFLITKDEEVIYNFFTWSLRAGNGILLLGVSNIMDLPERLSNRMSSRLKSQIARIVFTPYNHAQVKEILMNRLGQLELEVFKPQSIEYLARKASTVAGDVRAALKICQRAIELYIEEQAAIRKKIEMETYMREKVRSQNNDRNRNRNSNSNERNVELKNKNEIENGNVIGNRNENENMNVTNNGESLYKLGTGITNIIVKRAADEYKENPMIATMSRACLLDKRILCAACKHIRMTGDVELSMNMLWGRLEDFTLAVEAGRRTNGYTGRVSELPSMSVFYEAVHRLISQGLLQPGSGYRGAWRESTGVMYLNVSIVSELSDVLAAIRGDENLFLHYHINDD